MYALFRTQQSRHYITGLIRATAGTVSFDGKTLGKDLDFSPDTGVLIENPSFLSGWSGFDNLRLLASIRRKIADPEILKALQRVGLENAGKKKYRKYSLGMKQRLGIAAAIMEHPSLLILDEPTNALDTNGVECVRRIVREERDRGALVIIACHDRNVLEDLCSLIYQMELGRIVKEESL